jgi:transposase
MNPARRTLALVGSGWLTVERTPAYAPELNPMEGVWSNLKAGPLANRDDDIIEATVEVASAGVRKVRRINVCSSGSSLRPSSPI